MNVHRSRKAAAAVILCAAAAVWLYPERDAPKSVVPASPATSEQTAFGGIFGTAPGETGTTAAAKSPAADLAALPETLRNPSAATNGVVERVLQRDRGNRLFSDAADVERARADDTLMTVAPAETALGHLGFLTDRQRTDGRTFVRYDLRTLSARVEGDAVDILLPVSGVSAKGVVDQVETVDGMTRWTGHLLDFQEGGQFAVTHAPADDYAIGTFTTPLGTFAMEAKGGWGWIASQSKDFFLPAGGDDGMHVPEEAVRAPAVPGSR